MGYATLKLTLSYNANGGSGAPSPTTVSASYGVPGTKSLTVNASSTKPTRTGYNFTGWSPSSVTKSYNITQTAIDNNLTFTLTASTTAQWSLKTYAVKFNANGGSGAPAQQTKTYGRALTLSSTIPTRSGYEFVKWNTEPTGVGADYLPGASYTSNSALTLYAIWDKKVSDLNCNGGVMGTNVSITITDNTEGTVLNTITYSFGTATGTIADKTASKSLQFAFPTSLASQIPDSVSGNCTLTIESFVNGESIGSESKVVLLSVPGYTPSLSLAYTDGDATAAGIGILVQGNSFLNCTATPSTSYGATVDSFSVTINGTTFSNIAEFDTGTLSNGGTNTWTASVTDSRGITGSASGTFYVYSYSAPSVSLTVERSASDDSVAIVSILHSVSQLDGNNTKAYDLSWDSGSDSGSFTDYSGTLVKNYSVSIDDTITFDCVVEDLFGSTNATFVLPSADSIVMRVDHQTKEVYFPHEIYVGADKRPVPTGGSEAWEKIWENPSPTSSFASQTFNLADLAHCTKVYVQFNYTNSDQSTGGGCLIPYVGGDDVVGGQGVSVGSSYYYVRGVRVNWGANTVQFMGGYRGTTAGNNYCIPRCIYGVKGR